MFKYVTIFSKDRPVRTELMMAYDLLSSYCVRIFILFFVVFITMKIFKKSYLVKR